MTAVFLCWVPVGVPDTFKKKSMYILTHKPPYSTFSLTQDYLGISILSQASGWALQNSLSCLWRASSSCYQEESLWSAIALPPSHIFQSQLPFIPHEFRPALNFRHVSRLKHCPIPWQRQQIRWRRHYLYIDPPWDIHFWIVVPWHHLVHNTRSVTNFTGHLVCRFPGGCQTV